MRTEDGKATEQKQIKTRVRRQTMGGEDGQVERMENARPSFSVSVGLSSLQHREDATCLCDTNEKARMTGKKKTFGVMER